MRFATFILRHLALAIGAPASHWPGLALPVASGAVRWMALGAVAWISLGVSALCADEAAKEAFFRDQVLPIFENHCYECHSHQSQTMKGGLALDYRSGWEQGGDSGAAVEPGDAEASLLLQAIRREGGLEMPPDSPLDAQQVMVVQQWISDGAVDPRTATPPPLESDWWSLRELTRPAVPIQSQAVTTLNPIDAFIAAELSKHGMQPAPRADRRDLLRRLYIDLLGIPPSYEEVAAFQADESIDAYERLVDRLLASPAYGQRWARHWMDTIHFAESHGFEHDVARPNAWPYRDYLISRFNGDVPWSRLVREQLAADHFFPNQPQWTPALGFLGAGTFDISSFTTAPKTFAYLDRDDMVTQTMAAVASTTVNCARCHTHKFDPVTQDDYFALQAVFAGLIKGDVAFDSDPTIAAERKRLQALNSAIETRAADVVLADQWNDTVRQWEQRAQADAARWTICDPTSFDAAGGPRLEKQTDASLLAQAPYPEQAEYVVTFQPPTKRIAAIRIEAMTDPTLPANGPGAASNGNLHLSEVKANYLVGPNKDKQALRFSRATADFDQEGWTAAHAIDGQPQTAWGIHPQESRSHAIVVELAEPMVLDQDAQIELSLEQSHGRSHIIGRFRVAVTDQSDVRLSPLSDAVIAALHTPADARTADQNLLIATEAMRAYVAEQLAKLPPPSLVYAAGAKVLDGNGITAQTIAAPSEIHVLSRGDVDKPVRPIGPGSLSAIQSLNARFDIDPASGEAARRAALADWLVDPKNPLTWRSIANRVWHYHFGRGLCDTPSDFGRMGGEPSHPELLDWLACDLRDDGESLKRLHRLIVTSHSYCQAAEGAEHTVAHAMAVDGENRWLWRQNRWRLDADCFRDAVLATSGRIDRTFGGASVQQFSTSPGQQLTPMLDYSTFEWSSPQAGRRSIYRFVWRGIADPFMESLDFPDLGLLTPKRGESSSALQALAMYNNDFVLFHAQWLAERVASEHASRERPSEHAVAADPLAEQLATLFRSTLQREPTEAELKLFRPLAEEHGLAAVARVVFNSNEFLFLD